MELADFQSHACSLARRYKLYGRVAGDEEDVIQEAMIAAWVALGKWNGTGELPAYVKQRMEFRVIDYVRVRAKGPTHRDTVDMPDERAGPDVTLGTVLERERLRTVVDTVTRLPNWQRSRLIRKAEGGSNVEMAAADGCTVTAIDQALYQGRKALKLALAA